MAIRKPEMKKRLIEQRDRLLVEMDALRNKVAGLEMAIALMDGDDALAPTSARRPQRGSGKTVLLDLLKEAGTTGLNAALACEIGERRGTTLDRGTVSSLLSRFKKEGIVTYDGDKYRLLEFAIVIDEGRRSDGAPAGGLKVVAG